VRQGIVIALLSLFPSLLWAAEVTDSAGRLVRVPDKVERLMAAGPNAAVLAYVLAPDKMIGWPSAPRPAEREFLLPAARVLPEFGRLTGRGDTANVEVVLAARPDLVFDFGSVTPTYVSLADRVAEQTGFAYLLLDGRLDQSACSARRRASPTVPRRSPATSRRRSGSSTLGSPTSRPWRGGASIWRARRTASKPGSPAPSIARSSSGPVGSTSPNAAPAAAASPTCRSSR
jgi:hypothetical protein